MPKKTLLASSIAAAVAAIFLSLRFGCPILTITGIPCPGCGMTRACLAFLHLDFARAFLYHPMFPAVMALPVVFLGYLVWWAQKQHRQQQPFRLADLGSAAGSFLTARAFLVFLSVFFVADLSVYIYRVVLPLLQLGDPTVLRILISG